MPLLPPHTHRDAGVLLTTRGIRGFVDGIISLSITALLPLFGFSGLQIGIIVTGMLLGSAAATVLVGTKGYAVPRRTLLFAGSALMIATGTLFGLFTSFVALLVVGVIGTLNPTAGDVSVFLPLEQSMLAGTTPAVSRTALYARYTFVGGIAGAFGTLAIRIPEAIAQHTAMSEEAALRWCFAVYVLAGVVVLLLYRRLDGAEASAHAAAAEPLGRSKRVVYRLAALFSLDAFGGGFVVQSMLALWLFRRNCFLIAAAFMPTMPLAVTMLVLRSLLSSMDVPARTSYVMAVVSPAERAAAASVTNVPRSLAAALPPEQSTIRPMTFRLPPDLLAM